MKISVALVPHWLKNRDKKTIKVSGSSEGFVFVDISNGELIRFVPFIEKISAKELAEWAMYKRNIFAYSDPKTLTFGFLYTSTGECLCCTMSDLRRHMRDCNLHRRRYKKTLYDKIQKRMKQQKIEMGGMMQVWFEDTLSEEEC